MKVTAVIPTLNPGEKLWDVAQELAEAGFERLLIVNDGSSADRQYIFDRLAQRPDCTVLAHPCNKGKGRGLKTAFEYYLHHDMGHIGVVTLDDDGQHTLADALRCAENLRLHPDSLTLGVRDFSGPDVPPKSRFGNRITSGVFRLACGLAVSDTQTGLRAIPSGLLASFLNVAGERFEYETNMLLETKVRGIPIAEVPISTVYINENRSTHFHPLLDSWRIYKLLLKFIAASLLSFVVDIGLFWLLSHALPIESTTQLVFFSTAGARAASSLVNYFTNRLVVFRRKDGLGRSMARYYALCVVQGLASFGIVSLLSNLVSPRFMVLWKFMTDLFLFLCSFRIQDRWVFSQEARDDG